MARATNSEEFKAGDGDLKVSKKALAKGKAAVEKKVATLGKLLVTYEAIDSIKPNSYNPNRQSEHDHELLIKSMKEDGFTQPIVCLRSTREIVDGEHRWRAAHKLGYTEIPVVFTDMTPEQARIATLRHNRARGSEDIDLAAQVLRDLRDLGALDHAMDSLSLTDDEVSKLLDDVPAPEALAAATLSEAWNPVSSTAEAKPEGAEGQTRGGSQQVSATYGALEAQRQAEQKLAVAKTEAEKATIKKELEVHRVVCTFSGDEAAVVKQVLGEQQAEALLKLCRDELARRQTSK